MHFYFPIFLCSLFFVAFFIWYLASDNIGTRRISGLAAILASVFTCLLALQSPIRQGIDLKGGTVFLLQVQGNPTPQAMDEASTILRRRLDTMGSREISIVTEGADRLKIEIPGLQKADTQAAEEALSRTAKLELRMVPDNYYEIVQQYVANGNRLPFDLAQKYEILQEVAKDKATGKTTRYPMAVLKEIALSGNHVTSASRSVSKMGLPTVSFSLDNEGTRVFADLSSNNIGKMMCVILDKEVRTKASFRDAILTGKVEISGDFTILECDELASVLQNPLENEIKILNESTVEASLGSEAIRSGFNAGILALILVVGFMTCYYLLSGVVAVVALSVNLILLFGLLAQLQFTLTLPGIAGIVLTIGMAVDANVLIYERIRDELALGKTARGAIDLGFEKAFSAIFDSNVTTLIPAVVLAYMGTGPLRGFAVTLVLGIIANLFAALIVSRTCFDWMLKFSENPNLKMFQFLKSPRFNFLKFRYHGLALSLLLLGAGITMVLVKGDSLLGVDFRGGDSQLISYQEKIDIGVLSAKLRESGYQDFLLQYISSGDKVLSLQTAENKGVKATKILSEAFPQAKFESQSIEKVGSQIGGEMKQKAITALFFGLLGILIYAAIRFEWSYAVAAAIGQLHDVLIALCIMALCGSELTLVLVGAFLTIAGYSINDKIVVFDRIREGVKLREKGTFFDAINRSLNLTLARTILTGGTCLLATLALIIFGGPVIHDFSIAMFVGIMSGIYSSHFISPGIAWWLDHKHQALPKDS